ncbi:MAG: NAD(+) synthase [Saccharofermentanales bacterium]
MHDGFLRVAAATPAILVADCKSNRDRIFKLIRRAEDEQVQLVVFPELCLTGSTCGDLFFSRTLLTGAADALLDLAAATSDLAIISVIGLPLADGGRLYNVAAVLHKGKIMGFVPKFYLQGRVESGEARCFSPGPALSEVPFADQNIPFGRNLLFGCPELPDLQLAVEIGHDLWAARSPAIDHAAAGATIIANPSACCEFVGRAARRRLLVQSQSARLICAYVHANAGEGESSTDLVFAGHNLIYEKGRQLHESPLFSTGLITADVDLQALMADRQSRNIGSAQPAETHRSIPFSMEVRPLALRLKPSPLPFVPADQQELAARCEEVLSLQAAGLRKRLQHTACRSVLIGLSGGLDSTLALLVAVRAFDSLQLDRKGISAVIMPGLGTTERTQSNAISLANDLGVAWREISISRAVLNHFQDIGHDPDTHDVTYENAQARERTQILMDLANKTGGMVIGTGDLSELALGWTTYNGDHMSMYGVNSSVPKTLLRHLIRHAATSASPSLRKTLLDILDTPISPELLPPEAGKIAQKTEQLIGPYDLHDFFLYYTVRYGFTPAKIKRLAEAAFADAYSSATIRHWLQVFTRRFFAQQFKRSCLPDGPQIGSVALSPRGNWKMPSDAVAKLWLET